MMLLAALAALDVSGVVFVDRNRNGARDPGEPGLANVVVSDQAEVVVTGADGRFRIGGSKGFGLVFVSVPTGYASVGGFWKRVPDGAGEVSFGLTPDPTPSEVTFVHASDVHVSPATAARTERFRALLDSIRPAFTVVTGDLVRDALGVPESEASGYFELFAQTAATVAGPIWTVPGNRDLFGIERSASHADPSNPLYGRGMYRKYRGPDYYSFNYAGIHFVGLATADFDGSDYYGHVDSLQLAWLVKDVAAAPAGAAVVTFNHIPFFASGQALLGYFDAPGLSTAVTVGGRTTLRHTVSNAAVILAAIGSRPYPLALGGHFHLREQVRYEGIATRFDQAAAVVGPARGAGTTLPSGITVYRIRNGTIDEGRFVPLATP